MFEGLERISSTSDWVTIFFVVVLILIAVLNYNFTERFYKLFSLVYSDKYYTDFIKTRPLNFNIFHIIFFFVVLFNISMLIFFVCSPPGSASSAPASAAPSPTSRTGRPTSTSTAPRCSSSSPRSSSKNVHE